jgi:hypothetical protein
MTISEISQYRRCTEVWRGVRTGIMRLCIMTILLSLSRTHSMYASTAFDVTGSQFHQRDPEDAGEARICIRNTGSDSLSMAHLKVRILAKKAADLSIPTTECRCVYAKLSPPVLRPGQYGEILAKLLERPGKDCCLTCTISTGNGAVSDVVRLAEAPLWIPLIGFSEDLRRAFIYVENPGRKSIEAELLKVGDFDVAHRTKRSYLPVPPGDKRCLIGNLPSALSEGRFVHVVIEVNTSGRESKVHAVTRIINAFPLVMEHGTSDPRLALDILRPFLQTMACPAHAHGTPEAAAAKFLDDYAQHFMENPSRVIQMTICRADMPRAWFRFGDLPDVATMNTCLRPPSCYDKEPQKWFCPFSCLGDLAKRATEPGRFLAIILTGPDINELPFLLKGLTSQEWRFLVYCAVASGAKGVIYRHRGQLVSDSLSRDAFRQLNRELHHLKPLLSIAEPVEWITTEQSNYVAKSLLCGDQAILVIVFDSRYFRRQRDGRFYTPPFGRAVIPVRVNGKIPHGITVQEVTTPFESLNRDNWDFRNGVLELTADMIDSAQMYIIYIQSQTHPKEGELSQ